MTKHLCWNILDRCYSKKNHPKSVLPPLSSDRLYEHSKRPAHPYTLTPTYFLHKDRQWKAILHHSSATAHKQIQQRKATTHINKIIKPYILIQPTYRLHLLPAQIPPRHIQILLQPPLIITLRNNRHIPLRRPPQQHLCRRLAIFLRYLDNRGVLEE